MNQGRMNQLDDSDEARDVFARHYKQCHGHLPLILHDECYEFFGDFVKIVRANVYNEIKDAEVTVEGRLGSTHTLEFAELSWKHGRRTMERIAETPSVSVN